MDRRNFLKAASGFALLAAGATTGVSGALPSLVMLSRGTAVKENAARPDITGTKLNNFIQ